MGQVSVTSVRTEQVLDLLAALDESGFEIQPVKSSEDGIVRSYCCRRGSRELGLETWRSEKDQDESFVVLPYPPYSIRPWRWRADNGFFNSVREVVAGFGYLDIVDH